MHLSLRTSEIESWFNCLPWLYASFPWCFNCTLSNKYSSSEVLYIHWSFSVKTTITSPHHLLKWIKASESGILSCWKCFLSHVLHLNFSPIFNFLFKARGSSNGTNLREQNTFLPQESTGHNFVLIPVFILGNSGCHSSCLIIATILLKPLRGLLSLDHIYPHLYLFNGTLNCCCFIHGVIYGTGEYTLIITF